MKNLEERTVIHKIIHLRSLIGAFQKLACSLEKSKTARDSKAK